MDILIKTFNEMTDIFSSTEFGNKAVENGYSRDRINKNGLHPFLKKYAKNQGYRSKTWVKNTYKPQNTYIPEVNGQTLIFKSDIEIINYIKSKGYKIMKPVNEWKEI